MAEKAKATHEQMKALERAMEAHGVRPRDPAHPMRERPRDALSDALANGLDIGTRKEGAGFLAASCHVSDVTAYKWLRNSKAMSRDAVALALDALAGGILNAPEADGPYADEIAFAEQDANLSESHPGFSFETPEERAGRYAFEVLFMGMAEADRHKILEIEAMHAIHFMGDDSLEALLNLLRSLGAGTAPLGGRVRDAERPGHERQAAAWANDVLIEAEELKEWADGRRKEPDEPLPF